MNEFVVDRETLDEWRCNLHADLLVVAALRALLASNPLAELELVQDGTKNVDESGKLEGDATAGKSRLRDRLTEIVRRVNGRLQRLYEELMNDRVSQETDTL